MSLEPPKSLSPSRIAAFTDCALAFRFSSIDRLPEPPSVPATRGTLVHGALERLFELSPTQRTLDTAMLAVDQAFEAMSDHPDFTGLDLDAKGEAEFVAVAKQHVSHYFDMEDPTTINPIGLELKLETELKGTVLRGIIDRLERDDDGLLVVTDYKTGRVPSVNHEQGRLEGVHYYALLCERTLGERPDRIQLLYLADSVRITAVPTTQSINGHERKANAIWSAIELACEREEFRPKPSKLCDWCSFKQWCPAFGGDPSQASRDLEEESALESAG